MKIVPKIHNHVFLILLAGILFLVPYCKKLSETDESDQFKIQYCIGISHHPFEHPSLRFSHIIQKSNNRTLLKYRYNNNGEGLSFEYDSLDRLQKYSGIHSYGNEVFYTYDGLSDRVVSINYEDEITYCTYDDNGFLSKQEHFIKSGPGESLVWTKYFYYNDQSGQPSKQTIIWEDNNRIAEYYYTYDGKNHPFKYTTVQRGETFSDLCYPIHLEQNILRRINIQDGDTLIHNFEYLYDDNNFPYREKSLAMEVRFHYDGW